MIIKHIKRQGCWNRLSINVVFTIIWLLQQSIVFAQNDLYPISPAWSHLSFVHWKGIVKKGESAEVSLPGTAVYTVPAGSKGWYQRGLMIEHDGVIDVRQWYGLSFEIELQQDTLFEAAITLKIPVQEGRHNLPDSTKANVKLSGKGWHTVTVPFSAFDYNRGQIYMLKFIQQLAFTGKYIDHSRGAITLRNVKLIKGNPIHLEAIIRSKPGEADSVVNYTAQITNSSAAAQQVTLTFRNSGWEGMQATVQPNFFRLLPGEKQLIKISVKIPALAPPGSQESHTLVATTSQGASDELKFITLRKLQGPYLVHTDQGWQEVLAKTRRYDWAKQSLQEYIRRADEFEVPETPEGNIGSDAGTKAVFKSYIEHRFWPVAVAYKLTGERKYAEKLALLMRRLSAPGAYSTTLHAVSQGIPQEGGFWEGIARCYDLIRDAGVLSQKDKVQIEQSMRLYIYTVEDAMGDGGISNWSLFNLCPAAQCALAIQDMYHFNYLMEGPCGIADHIRYGIMDDGWWYEMSLSYNLGCAENLTALGIAAKPFGIDLLHKKFPVALTQKVGLRPFEFENFLGMAFGKFGPVQNNFIDIKRMWEGIIAYPDFRGVMFGMGDGHEHEVGGGAFELAYFAFRDTAFASVIKQGGRRDLVYGVPQLPDNTPLLYTQSAHSDNAGIAVLRSQTVGRQQKDQIQAALKYGTHGSYHGHFDRLSLLSLMRYGRSFYNPETSWFGYGSYMYKWWVQPSVSHNMVVVDGKQQQPVESKPLLFHTGKMMQVMGAETNARWSNPPYFGGYNQLEKVRKGEAPYVPIYDNHPKPGEITAYTEPIIQRRLLIVTDDYVVTADYLKASKEHVFDNLLHLRGAMPGADLKLIGHDAQFDTSALSSGQFITNVDKYVSHGTANITSLMKIGNGKNWETGGQKSQSIPGELYIDAYNAWPQKETVLIGNYAESWSINKKLKYEIVGDNNLLATDSLGTWILGKGEIAVDVKGIKNLQLKTYTNRSAKTLNTLFWANAILITKNGKQILLSSLNPSKSGIIDAKEKGKDYDGGPVQIAGNVYTDVLPAEPEKLNEAGVLSFDISGLNAVSLKIVVGGDYPVGDETQLRKTVSFRSKGREAMFLTTMEPYESSKMVKKVKALDANTIEVSLMDGRVQQIKIEGLSKGGNSISLSIKEWKNDKLLREERVQRMNIVSSTNN